MPRLGVTEEGLNERRGEKGELDHRAEEILANDDEQ